MGGKPRVAVVGGSLGGLTAALLFRDLGCQVEIYERSTTEPVNLGAGIVAHQATVRYLLERSGIPIDRVSTASNLLRYLEPDGSVLYEEPRFYRYTSWSTLYYGLLEIFGRERYHRGASMVGFEQHADGVEVRLAGGARVRCDLLICADGIMSTARQLLLPGTRPRYAGYVGWRGTVAPDGALNDAIVYSVVERSHILAYPIPDESRGRVTNFVWYRNAAHGEPLLGLTGRSMSVQPPAEYVEELRLSATSLPPLLREIVRSAARPFVQVVVDVEVPRMAFGRVCLIGDAAFAARPHAAAGTAKAAENAWTLAAAFEASGGDVVEALEQWEPGQLDLGRSLVARSREIGVQYQVSADWRAEDEALRFGLYAAGDSSRFAEGDRAPIGEP
jgi:2,6-dihydroxypyridine 3-monooxygenase